MNQVAEQLGKPSEKSPEPFSQVDQSIPGKTAQSEEPQIPPTPNSNQGDEKKDEAEKDEEKGWLKQSSPWIERLLVGGATGSAGLATLYIWHQLRKVVGDPKKDLTEYLESPNYDSQVSFIENFHADFKKIVDAYAGKGNKVYVFIDDLDRCEVPKSAELMQAINLMISNDPQLVFILGMDREKVAAGLAVKYKEVIPYLSSSIPSPFSGEPTALQGIEYGYTFIEKFVQLPFLVPHPSQADFGSFVSKLSVADQLPDQNRWWQVVRQFFWSPIQDTCNRLIQEYENLKSPTAPSTSRTPSLIENREGSNETERQQTQERLKVFELRYGSDSPEVRNILTMVAPALDWNPRRLKQFLNLFRLRAYIAHATGLLDTVDNPAVRPLTLEQLGKFTAIGLKWPLLRVELAQEDRGLLAKLQRYALTGTLVDIPDSMKSWDDEPELLALLRHGCSDPSTADRYSLEQVEVGKLFQVSPLLYSPIDRIPLRSKWGMKYDRLRNLLKDGLWREADKETYRVMLEVARRERQVARRKWQGYLSGSDVANFPCQDLQTIDQLWVVASRGWFGFSVQKKIYVECGAELNGKYPGDKIWDEFCERVGWKTQGKYVNYSDLKANLPISPKGEFPVFDWVYVRGLHTRFSAFNAYVLFSRGAACGL